MNDFIEALRKKHNLGLDFSMAIEGAAMKFILARQEKLKESKTVRTRFKNIDTLIERITKEYKLASKESRSVHNALHVQMELLESLQKNNQELLDINNRAPLFTQLKKDIHKIFTVNGIPYTRTFSNYKTSDEYKLLRKIRVQGGMSGTDFDLRVGH